MDDGRDFAWCGYSLTSGSTNEEVCWHVEGTAPGPVVMSLQLLSELSHGDVLVPVVESERFSSELELTTLPNSPHTHHTFVPASPGSAPSSSSPGAPLSERFDRDLGSPFNLGGGSYLAPSEGGREGGSVIGSGGSAIGASGGGGSAISGGGSAICGGGGSDLRRGGGSGFGNPSLSPPAATNTGTTIMTFQNVDL
jgi:hypothetical protein